MAEVPQAKKEFGTRVARARRLRGLTQVELAKTLDRSVAWMSQVERGTRHIDRMSVLEELAEKLEVPLAELLADPPAASTQVPASGPVERLRAILLTARALPHADSASPVIDLAEVSRELDTAWEHVHSGEYTELAVLLEPVVPTLDRLCAGLDSGNPAKELLASAYQAMAAAFSKLGEIDDAWISSDRAFDAARSSGDPLLTAVSVFRQCVVFQGARRYTYVEREARNVAEALEGRFDELGDPGRSVWGVVTLQRAVAAARSNEADHAYALIDAARSVAAVVGDGRNDFHTEFGPANVAIHEVAVAVDLGDAGRALRVAGTIDAGSLSAERRCRLLIDIARAHAQRRDGAQAVQALLGAEALVPAITRQDHYVQQVTRDLLTVSDGPSPKLRGLAERIGIVPR